MTATVEYGIGSLSLFEVAKQAYYTLLPDNAPVPNFESWCKYLWERKDALHCITARLPNGTSTLLGLAIGGLVNSSTVHVEWVITPPFDVRGKGKVNPIFAAYLNALREGFPTATVLTYEQNGRVKAVNLQKFLSKFN